MINLEEGGKAQNLNNQLKTETANYFSKLNVVIIG